MNEDADDEQWPYLPIDLILREILPHAFDEPKQVMSLALVCSYFADGPRRAWFWIPWMSGQRKALQQRVLTEVLDASAGQREGLRLSLANWNSKMLIQALGVSQTVQSIVGGGKWRTIVGHGQMDDNLSCYVGQVNDDGMRHGIGVLFYSSGNNYVGEFQADHFHGPCVFTWKCGMVYRGHCQMNVKVGRSRWTFCDGTFFDANFALSRQEKCLPQRGYWNGNKEDTGVVIRAHAEWHLDVHSAAMHPFLLIEKGGERLEVHESRGVPETITKPSEYCWETWWFSECLQLP